MGAPTHRGIVRLLRFFSCCTLLIAAETAFAAFSMIEIISPSLGTFFGGVSGRNFILNTDGTITGTDAADYMLGAIGGELEMKKTGGPVSANIVAENISTYGGLSVASVLCKYQNQAQTTCSGSGINVSLKGKRKLLLGINVTTTQFHGGGDTAGASMDITVTFL